MKRNKVALITGAGRGIGRVVTLEFAKSGYRVIVISKTRSELEETKALLGKDSGSTKVLSVDVSKPQSVKRAFSKIKHLDVLVNAAGIQGPIGEFSKNERRDWVKTIDVNLLGTVNVIRAALSKMRQNGTIINFSGGGALTPRQNFSSYAVSKVGIVRLTEILAKELKSKNVRVNAISPGAINTKMFEEMFKAGKEKVGSADWKRLKKQKKEGGENPVKAAKLCLFLASKKSSPLTGKVISAVYDNWQEWDKDTIKKLARSDWLTLRRLDPYTIDKLNKLKI